jgi:hypothetical protein
VVPNHATFSRFDLGSATPNLPSFAKLFSIYKNLTINRYCNARVDLAFALRGLSFSITVISTFAFSTRER